MRAVFSFVLIIGVGLAGFAVYMAKGVFDDYQKALATERAARGQVVPTTEVYVVEQAMRYGQQITKENVRAVMWPKSAVPEGTYTAFEELFPEGEKQFRTVLRAMEKDEAIMKVKVTEPGEDAGVSARLASGKRAFAIKVDVASGVSGFISPGDRVDVYWTGQTGSRREAGGGEVTQLILTNVHIIAIDQRADLDRTAPLVARTVTVEATPDQVGRLNLAQNTGRLTLALVGHSDETVARDVLIDQNALLGIEVEETVEAPKEPTCTVRTRRGGEIIVTEIPCPTN
ncbi:Flp pilus assembly protein CpaB [Sinisalibacter lacisalsi]|uniref:Flp pilus assembly protein CpaB n=1 Tax=Sinisalibacter lacisalsi TaxID=1526570 RepID=A0ABQ1QPV1_9RHOB|nr:Flp pilus assembly protein CpaB [Sinisalibacter lacisalsi]GGD39876.1 Flp pilus assembly protein CpaB [Sinisalibacter lacisalsi]